MRDGEDYRPRRRRRRRREVPADHERRGCCNESEDSETLHGRHEPEGRGRSSRSKFRDEPSTELEDFLNSFEDRYEREGYKTGSGPPKWMQNQERAWLEKRLAKVIECVEAGTETPFALMVIDHLRQCLAAWSRWR